ncbi:hypothetical protein [Photobacterium leiognathi]|uniref:hypothetical protein n=1 Tax=Photobacterium leiognathi TaxID=553611 RepID=UPI000ABFAD1A|nr:hypothetical protein [Photobacterium leiognathi]
MQNKTNSESAVGFTGYLATDIAANFNVAMSLNRCAFRHGMSTADNEYAKKG